MRSPVPSRLRHSDRVGHEVHADPEGSAQRGGHGVGFEPAPPRPIAAQRVHEQLGVEAIVLLNGRVITTGEIFDLFQPDHHHGLVMADQGVGHRAVRPFNADLSDTVPGQELNKLAQVGDGVLDRGVAAATAAGDNTPALATEQAAPE